MGVLVGVGVLVGAGVLVGVRVAVGVLVAVGVFVAVGSGVSVGGGASVGSTGAWGTLAEAARAPAVAGVFAVLRRLAAEGVALGVAGRGVGTMIGVEVARPAGLGLESPPPPQATAISAVAMAIPTSALVI